ncbi:MULTISPECIES: hypothetical protein [Sphingobium]|uniref:AB hydrolase-1 domain-containing protein n=1 Tax=Sphingobium cupriresistens LL01 TaxID=1420583 RepID=A0A0J7XQR1_9SPHN|nr:MULTISPECIES: hypothetical protein [Sphingobium]KMS53403.1 hypothetical protein V473_20425 [Sphingobium cupriresistens LL01]MBJ7376062.1 hypothetical protein [Sphingobium sp.]
MGGKQGGWIWNELIAALVMQAPDIEPPLILDIPGCGAKRGRDTSGLGLDAVIEELAHDIAWPGSIAAYLSATRTATHTAGSSRSMTVGL